MKLLLFALAVWLGTAGTGARAGSLQLEDVVVRRTPVLADTLITPFADRVDRIGPDQISGLNAQDLTSALRRHPGITVSRYNIIGAYGGADGGSVYIRGHGSSRPGTEIMMMFDGIPRLVGVWTHPLMDMHSVDVAEWIEVYKSPQPVLMGNMAFGAVNTIPKQAIAPLEFTSRTLFSYGSYDTRSIRFEGAALQDEFDVYAVASHRRSDGHRPRSSGRADLFYARMGMQLDENWRSDIHFMHTDAWAYDPGREDAPHTTRRERFNNENDFYLVTVSHRHDGAEGYIKGYYDDGSILWEQWHQPPPAPFPAQNLDTETRYSNYGVRLRESVNPLRNMELIAGFDADFYGGEVKEHFELAEDLKFNRLMFRNISPYIMIAHTFGEKLRITPSAGARYTDNRHFENSTSGQGGFTLQYGDSTIYAQTSRAYNYAGVYGAVLATKWGRGDAWKDLDPESIDHREIGAQQRVNSWMNITVSAFHSEVSNALRLSPPPQPRMENIGGYTMRGIEIQAAMTPAQQLRLFLGGTWNNPQPNDVPNTPEWTFSGGCLYLPVARITMNLDVEYVGGQTVINPRFGQPQEAVSGYTLVSARTGYRLRQEGHSWNGELFVGGENLTNQNYEYSPGYPMPGTTWMAGLSLDF